MTIHIVIQQSYDGVESLGPCFVHREHAVAAAEKIVARRDKEDEAAVRDFVEPWKAVGVDTWTNGLYEVTVRELPVNEGPDTDEEEDAS